MCLMNHAFITMCDTLLIFNLRIQVLSLKTCILAYFNISKTGKIPKPYTTLVFPMNGLDEN